MRSADLHQGVAADWSRLQADGRMRAGTAEASGGSCCRSRRGTTRWAGTARTTRSSPSPRPRWASSIPRTISATPDPRDGDGGAGEGIPDITPDLRVQGAAPAAIGTAAIGQSQSGAEDDAGLRCRWGSLGDR